MPTFWFDNRYLIFFSAFKKHIGFYPASSRVFEVFKEEMTSYKQSGKGTVQFPLNRPMPLELIRKIVEFRVAENLEKNKEEA